MASIKRQQPQHNTEASVDILRTMKFEEGVTLNKWCTPLMLFLTLNFMIIAILFTSRSGNQKKKQQQHLGRSPSMLRRLKLVDMFHFAGGLANNANQQAAQMMMMMEDEEEQGSEEQHEAAFKSLNERYSQRAVKRPSSKPAFREAEAAAAAAAAAAAFEFPPKHKEEGETEAERSIEEVYSQLLQSQESQMSRTKSDTGAVPVKLAKKMKKSTSSKSAFRHFKEAEIVEARRPATVKAKFEKEDEQVDSKADDFISMFKQQLKLQRLDSILRYKEMLDRGASR